MTKFIPQGLGWIPDLPDPRDYTCQHPKVRSCLTALEPQAGEPPSEVDLRGGEDGELYLTDAADQGEAHASTAFAILSLVEYFRRRVHGNTFDGSQAFLYSVARRLRAGHGQLIVDGGVDLRTTLKALRHFGVPDSRFCPYQTNTIEEEPTPFAFQIARRMQGIRYFRIDQTIAGTGGSPWKTLTSFLAAGFPVVFGFSVPASISTDPHVPFRRAFDTILGGKSALAIGYRLHHFGPERHAILFRASWGNRWGDNGNGWLPVRFLDQSVMRDMWTLCDVTWPTPTDLYRPSVVD